MNYKGFEYEKKADGSWRVFLPGGGKITAPPQTEDALKAALDKLVS